MTTLTKKVDFDTFVGFTSKQLDAERAALKYKHVLYGGAAGGGKSYWLRWSLIRDLLRLYAAYRIEGIQVGLFCESYPALRDRHLHRVRMEFPPWLGSYKESVHEFHLRKEYGGGMLLFRNLADPANYLSAEMARIGIDELTQNPRESVYDFLQTRLRWSGIPEIEYGFRNATNPGGPGHSWAKRRWIDRRFLPWEKGEDYVFVQAFARDNPHLPSGYVDQLSHLPPELRAAYLEGRWDIFAGQVFAEWNPAIHVIEPFQIPRRWIRFRAIDYGFAAPSAVGWFAVRPPDRVVMYRELYEAGYGPKELAELIKEYTPEAERISYNVADPSLFRRNEVTGERNSDTFAANGVPLVRGHNDRISGWRALHDFLHYDLNDPEPKPHLQVTLNCVNFIRTFPMVPYDDKRIEDVDSSSEDHMADMGRYAIMSRPPLYEPARLEEEEEEPAGRNVARIRREYERERPRETDEYI